jgi:N-formylglutamate deformylase
MTGGRRPDTRADDGGPIAAGSAIDGSGNVPAVYLSRQDVLDLVSDAAAARRLLDVGRGLRDVALNAATQLQDLPEGAVGVLAAGDGALHFDDGSLQHPARTGSWRRSGPDRLSEHALRWSHTVAAPTIVHAPHVSQAIPAAVRRELAVTDTGLAVELDAMTDAGVAPVAARIANRSRAGDGPPATVVAATLSRLVFDPERFADDPMEAQGMGVVYTRRADGTPLRSPLPTSRREWYLGQHRAYTRSLERAVSGAVARCGAAFVVDLHSYARDPLGYEDPAAERPQVCVGVDPFHTPSWLTHLATETFAARFDTAVNTPFAGAYVPGRLYRRERRVRALMVEVRRDVLGDDDARSQLSELLDTIIATVGDTLRRRTGD